MGRPNSGPPWVAQTQAPHGSPKFSPPMSVTKLIVPILVLGNSVPRVGSRGGGEEEEEEEDDDDDDDRKFREKKGKQIENEISINTNI